MSDETFSPFKTSPLEDTETLAENPVDPEVTEEDIARYNHVDRETAITLAKADKLSLASAIECENYQDENGNPSGGFVRGTGIDIQWQNGPLGRGDERQLPNGAFVENVILAAIQRIEFYQASKFHCNENQEAINFLRMALVPLGQRTSRRESQRVEGLNEGS